MTHCVHVIVSLASAYIQTLLATYNLADQLFVLKLDLFWFLQYQGAADHVWKLGITEWNKQILVLHSYAKIKPSHWLKLAIDQSIASHFIYFNV